MSNNTIKRVLIIAGGTGGHIFPAMAVAHYLQQRGIDIQWLGSRVGLEEKIVSGKYPITFISVKRIRGKGLLTKLLSPFRILLAIIQAWRAIKKIKPDVVLGMGGFVSGPGGVAARLQKIPLVIHEQNSVAGYTNRILAKFAKHILAGFPNAFSTSVKAKWVGNPVRDEIININPPEQRLAGRDQQQALKLFVLGGSQGAHALNCLMMELVDQFPELDRLSIWHQTGEADFDRVQEAYTFKNAHAKAQAFLSDMVEPYTWADLVLCRAGALTVAELAAVGVSSILVPFPFAVDNHQFYNAQFLQQADAGIIVPQTELNVARLQDILMEFLNNPSRLLEMANKGRALAKPDAAAEIAQACLQ